MMVHSNRNAIVSTLLFNKSLLLLGLPCHQFFFIYCRITINYLLPHAHIYTSSQKYLATIKICISPPKKCYFWWYKLITTMFVFIILNTKLSRLHWPYISFQKLIWSFSSLVLNMILLLKDIRTQDKTRPKLEPVDQNQQHGQRTISLESPACVTECWLLQTWLQNWTNVMKEINGSNRFVWKSFVFDGNTRFQTIIFLWRKIKAMIPY